MARHISTIKDVDEFCQVNLKDIIKRKNRWIRPNYKCDWEKGLFEKSIRFAGVSSEKNFLKMASKAKRNAWSCNFNNAIRQWLSKHNFPNEVQKDQVLHTNKCVRRSSDQSSVKSCEQNKLTNSEHDELDSEAFGSQEGEMISADMDLDMKIQESALDNVKIEPELTIETVLLSLMSDAESEESSDEISHQADPCSHTSPSTSPINDSPNKELPAIMQEMRKELKLVRLEITALRSEVQSLRKEKCEDDSNDNDAETFTKVCNEQEFLENEKKFLSKSVEDVAFRKKLSSTLLPFMSNKMNYSKAENSMIASVLTNYFEENFLKHLGWSSRDGRTSLNDKPGHIHFFFVTINRAFANTFKTMSQLSAGIPLVIKRLREKEKRHLNNSLKENKNCSCNVRRPNPSNQTNMNISDYED